MFDVLSVTYEDIRQMRRVAHALDVVMHEYKRVLPDNTIETMRQRRAEIVDNIEEWENTSL